jgi:hypothetical protein
MVQKNIRPVSEWIAQLDTLPNLEFVCLAGSVSEPTMYKEFIPLLEYLVGRGLTIELNTNANTHKPDWWRQIGDILTPNDRVIFTVCGSTQELHERYRVKSDLQEVLDHAAAFRSAGKQNDWIQHIRFEYNAADLESEAMQAIIAQFHHTKLIESGPYQERFNMTTDTEIKMAGKLGEKYGVIKTNALKRYQSKTGCKMRCKSYEHKFITIDNFGGEYPCFLYRIYKQVPFDHNDYSEIHKFEHEFCYECESLTTTMLERNGMERMI